MVAWLGQKHVVPLNLVKPNGFFTYRQFQHSKILYGARFALSFVYVSQQRPRPLLYTSLTDLFLQPWRRVFTARYGLTPYIKQITIILLK